MNPVLTSENYLPRKFSVPAKNSSSASALQKKIEGLPGRTRSFLVILLLTLVAAGVFSPVRNFDFINYDDDRYILNNPYLHEGFSWRGIQWAFAANLTFQSSQVDYWPLRRRAFREKIPLFLLSLAFSIQPFIGQLDSMSYSSPAVILSKIPIHYLSYLGKFLHPFPLTLTCYLPHVRFNLGQTVLASFILLTFSILVLRAARLRPFLLMGWFWFLVSLVPVTGLFRPEDRFMYLPMAGLLVFGVWGLWDFFPRWRFRGAFLMGTLMVSVFLILIRPTVLQLPQWKSSLTLFGTVLDLQPDNPVAANQLCATLLDRGEFERAFKFCDRAVKIEPDLYRAHYNLGLIRAKQGRYEEAVQHYKESLRYRPDYVEALSNLGVAYTSLGKWEEAIQHFLAAKSLNENL